MPKPKTSSGEKNLISKRLIALRKKHYLSQRDLSNKLQLAGYDMDFYTCHCTGEAAFKYLAERVKRMYYFACGDTLTV